MYRYNFAKLRISRAAARVTASCSTRHCAAAVGGQAIKATEHHARSMVTCSEDDVPLAEVVGDISPVRVSSTRAAFSNNSSFHHRQISPNETSLPLLEDIKRQQEDGRLSIDLAIAVEARLFKRKLVDGMNNLTNFADWGQATAAWVTRQSELTNGEWRSSVSAKALTCFGMLRMCPENLEAISELGRH